MFTKKAFCTIPLPTQQELSILDHFFQFRKVFNSLEKLKLNMKRPFTFWVAVISDCFDDCAAFWWSQFAAPPKIQIEFEEGMNQRRNIKNKMPLIEKVQFAREC